MLITKCARRGSCRSGERETTDKIAVASCVCQREFPLIKCAACVWYYVQYLSLSLIVKAAGFATKSGSRCRQHSICIYRNIKDLWQRASQLLSAKEGPQGFLVWCSIAGASWRPTLSLDIYRHRAFISHLLLERRDRISFSNIPNPIIQCSKMSCGSEYTLALHKSANN